MRQRTHFDAVAEDIAYASTLSYTCISTNYSPDAEARDETDAIGAGARRSGIVERPRFGARLVRSCSLVFIAIIVNFLHDFFFRCCYLVTVIFYLVLVLLYFCILHTHTNPSPLLD